MLGRFQGDRSCSGSQSLRNQGGMFFNFIQDIEGDLQCRQGLLAGDPGRAAGGDRVEEVLQLQTQGLVLDHRKWGEVDTHGRLDAIADAVLPAIVERNVLVGLKQAQFAGRARWKPG